MSNHKCEVVILDLDIPAKSQKLLQKLKAELQKTEWGAGNVHEDDDSMEFFEREILQQDLRILYYRKDRITIKVDGSDIDRDNLALIERILKDRAEIDINDGKLELEFRFRGKDYNKTYEQFGKFKSKDDIPRHMMIDGKRWDCEIHGYTWK